MSNSTERSASVDAGRLYEIDLLRAIACLMVVFFHYFYRGALEGWSPSVEPAWLIVPARYGYLGVHLFFMISGFVIFMSASNASPKDFVASRVSRLYPAFWVAVVLTWLVVEGFSSSQLQVSVLDMLVNLTMVPHWFGVPFVDGVYWSLAVEIQFYIIIWFVLRFGLMQHVELILAGWLVVAAVNAARPMYPVEFWLAADWAPYFCVGAVSFLIRSSGWTVGRLMLLFFAYLLALYYPIAKVLYPKGGGVSDLDPWLVGGWVTVFFGVFLLISFGGVRLRRNFWILWAGTLTYPVYLLHENIGYVLLRFFCEYGVPYCFSAAAVFGMVGCVAWAVSFFVERPLAPRFRRFMSGFSFSGRD